MRIRIKDKHAKALKSMAFDVNQVWNYCNELSLKVYQRERKLMSGYDLQKYTNGVTKEGLNLHSATVQAICSEFATRRSKAKKIKPLALLEKSNKNKLNFFIYLFYA